MKIKAKCAICGSEGEIEIDDKTKEIKSDWAYFGKITFPNGKVEEYWECPECLKDVEFHPNPEVEKESKKLEEVIKNG